MSNFSYLPEFEKEYKKLAKRYHSLKFDLETFESVLLMYPTGQGQNFTILHSEGNVSVVKARLACRTLRDRSLRVIYAHKKDTIEFIYIEIYAKNDKENEDRKRIKLYIDSFNNH